ncbi:uncharacterized protein UTRI_04579 [Ustilago trichophora]|uniref:Uncharacterized protein n=1 Tax=Ustilago trichophora TaxID=86804 RepID=A0A5C3EGX2_9BASI|nr:uncharacterized protein UTRI_04579 [Ustilago trichophora]
MAELYGQTKTDASEVENVVNPDESGVVIVAADVVVVGSDTSATLRPEQRSSGDSILAALTREDEMKEWSDELADDAADEKAAAAASMKGGSCDVDDSEMMHAKCSGGKRWLRLLARQA